MGLPGTNTMRTIIADQGDSVRFGVRFPPLKRGGNLTLGITHLMRNLTVANLLTDLTLPYENLTQRPYAKPYAHYVKQGGKPCDT